MAEPLRIQLFDDQQDVAIIERRLPHWSQAGTIAFLRWRTWDSIPEQILLEWIAERDELLQSVGIDPRTSHWQATLKRLEPHVQRQIRATISDRWNDRLDACHGDCVLRRPNLAKIVSDSLLHFDGDRYELTDFVVMPNHVHLLAAYPTENAMLEQAESWKRFTAVRINRLLKRTGRFWQADGFDHLVRTEEQFSYLRRYIAENPRRAGLRSGEFIHLSKPL
jgi:REP element-mobilizing transposase RayT